MKLTKKLSLAVASAAFLTLGAMRIAPASHAAALGPTAYRSFADSPFAAPFNASEYSYFHLENFEDGSLNTPGVSGNGSVLSPGSLTDSVDGDDGAIDGSGTGGRSFYSAGSKSFTFTFDAAVLGALPTDVGIVWTDVGFTNKDVNGVARAIGSVRFKAFNAVGDEIGPVEVGDGQFNGQTLEDRFFGATNAGGISSFIISMDDSDDWEIDHLQYGRRRVPEPVSTAGVLMMGTFGVGSLLKRRQNLAADAKRM